MTILLLIVNILFNSYLLSCIYILGFTLLHLGDKAEVYAYLPHWIWYMMGYITVLGLIGLSFTKIMYWLMRFWLNIRPVTIDEYNQIESLLVEVIAAINRIKNTSYSVVQLKLMIVDSEDLNAYALGYDMLIITKGLLNSVSKGELQAFLAYQLSYLYYKYSLTLAAIIFSSLGTRSVMWLYKMSMLIIKLIMNMLGEHNRLANILYIFLLLCFLPVIVFYWLGSKLLMICLLFYFRRCESQADRFVADLGYKDELIRFLDRTKIFFRNDNSLLGRNFPISSQIVKL